MKRKSIYTVAEHHLNILQSGARPYDLLWTQEAVEYVHLQAQNGGQSLKELGTSEEELREYVTRCCKRIAVRDLDIARAEPGRDETFFRLINVESMMKRGNFTPEDIGTSNDELNRRLGDHVHPSD